GTTDQGLRDHQALALSPGDRPVALHDGVQPHRHPLDVLGETRHLGRRHRLLRSERLGTADDVKDRPGERLGVLEHHTALTAHGGLVECAQVLAVVQHAARDRFVEADEQPEQSGLSTTARPHDGHELARLDVERHVVQDQRAVVGVPERQTAGLDRAGQDPGPGARRAHLGGRVQHRLDLLEQRQYGHRRHERAGELGDGRQQHGHRGVEGEEVRRRHRAARRARQQHEHQQGAQGQIHRAQHRVEVLDAADLLLELPAARELARPGRVRVVLGRRHPQLGQTAQGLERLVVQLVAQHHQTALPAHLPQTEPEEHRPHDHEHADRGQRHRHAVPEQQPQVHGPDGHRLGDHRTDPGEGAADRTDAHGRAGEFAGGTGGEELGRQPQQAVPDGRLESRLDTALKTQDRQVLEQQERRRHHAREHHGHTGLHDQVLLGLRHVLTEDLARHDRDQ
ncbi:hypothetical protein STRIP9103_08944, partial [Streptomyces ipomoeae 91-03]